MGTTLRPARTLPGPPLVGSALDLRRDVLGTLERAHRELGDVVRIVAGPRGWRHVLHGVFSPEGVERVLVEDPYRMTKGSSAYQELRAVLGDGLLTSEGELWRRQRRFVAPVLTRRRTTTSYAAVAVEEAQRVARRWDAPARTGPVDVHADMVDFTARFIGRVLLGADVGEAVPRLVRVAPAFNAGVLRRSQQPHPVPRSWPTPANRRLAAAVREQRAVVAELVAERRARGGADGEDLLGLLLAARDPREPGTGLRDREVADQVLVFLLAGHETTATTLACALVELARSPHWQGALHDEVDAALDGRPATGADLPRLPLADRVVREVLRLYPAAPVIPRLAPDGDTLLGYDVPPGSTVIVAPWVVHRDPALWPDPTRFDPSRFELGPDTGRDSGHPGGHRYAWVPFGAGPRACVGAQLAMVEAVLGLVTLLQHHRVSTDLERIPLVAGVALRPAGPLPVRVLPRGAGARRPAR